VARLGARASDVVGEEGLVQHQQIDVAYAADVDVAGDRALEAKANIDPAGAEAGIQLLPDALRLRDADLCVLLVDRLHGSDRILGVFLTGNAADVALLGQALGDHAQAFTCVQSRESIGPAPTVLQLQKSLGDVTGHFEAFLFSVIVPNV
jgi:hypothetical protein